jgi:hypothetical protein
MKTTLFAACAIAGLIAAPAMAQTVGAGIGAKATAAPPSAASPSMPSSALPSSKMPSTSIPATSPATATPPVTDPVTAGATATTDTAAATGTAANTAATASDLKMGAAVTDATGAEIGTISKVTKGKTDAETMVTLKANGKTKTVPASALGLSGGALVSSKSKADIWGPM